MIRRPYTMLLDPNPTDNGGPAPLGGSQQPPPPQKVTYTVNGVQHNFDLSDPNSVQSMVKLLEKAGGADEAFRKAAEMREAAKKIEEEVGEFNDLRETIEGFRNRDENAIRRMADLLDVEKTHPGLTDELIGVLRGQPTGGGGKKTAASGDTSTVGWEKLPSELREFFDECKQMGLKPSQALALAVGGVERWSTQEARTMTRKSLTADPILGRIMRSKSDSASAETLFNEVFADVEGRVNGGTKLADAISQSVKRFADVAAVLAPSDDPPTNPGFLVGPSPVTSARSALHPSERPKFDQSKLTQPGYLGKFLGDYVAYEDANSQNE